MRTDKIGKEAEERAQSTSTRFIDDYQDASDNCRAGRIETRIETARHRAEPRPERGPTHKLLTQNRRQPDGGGAGGHAETITTRCATSFQTRRSTRFPLRQIRRFSLARRQVIRPPGAQGAIIISGIVTMLLAVVGLPGVVVSRRHHAYGAAVAQPDTARSRRAARQGITVSDPGRDRASLRPLQPT